MRHFPAFGGFWVAQDGGDTPLMLSAWQGHVECCAFLVQRRAAARCCSSHAGHFVCVSSRKTRHPWMTCRHEISKKIIFHQQEMIMIFAGGTVKRNGISRNWCYFCGESGKLKGFRNKSHMITGYSEWFIDHSHYFGGNETTSIGGLEKLSFPNCHHESF